MQASVSVIIPTWNRANRVQAAIESALRQSYPISEVLVCDDGSTDDTFTRVAYMVARDSRVRWIEGPRGGRPAIPRNRGIRASRCEWLAFLDSDDIWREDKLEIELGAARRAGSLAACSNACRVLPDGSRSDAVLTWQRPRLTLRDLLSNNWVVCSSCVVHRDVLARTTGFPEGPDFRAVEDYALWLRVAACTEFAYCPQLLVDYLDDPKGGIRSDQRIAPHAQKKLVLEDMRDWLQRANLKGTRRASAIASIEAALIRQRIAALTHQLIARLHR